MSIPKTQTGLKKIALLYNLSDEEKALITEALAVRHINTYCVKREEYSLPISVILGIKDRPESVDGYSGEELGEPMMIMHGLGSKEIDAVLSALRENKVSIGLKAVTTPVNLHWNAMLFYKNLKMERDSLQRRR